MIFIKNQLFYLFVIISSFNISFAQISPNTSQEVISEIRDDLNSLYNCEFNVNGFSFNPLIAEHKITKINYRSEYQFNKLEDCVLFSGYKESPYTGEYDDIDSAIIGIYKDNQIIWSTGPILVGNFYKLYFADDITNNGRIEIGISGYATTYTLYEDLLIIISWDGANGKLINAFDEEEIDQQLYRREYLIYLILKNDGIFEIRSVWGGR